MHKNKDLLSTYNLHKKRCKDILKLGKSKHEGKKKGAFVWKTYHATQSMSEITVHREHKYCHLNNSI